MACTKEQDGKRRAQAPHRRAQIESSTPAREADRSVDESVSKDRATPRKLPPGHCGSHTRWRPPSGRRRSARLASLIGLRILWIGGNWRPATCGGSWPLLFFAHDLNPFPQQQRSADSVTRNQPAAESGKESKAGT